MEISQQEWGRGDEQAVRVPFCPLGRTGKSPSPLTRPCPSRPSENPNLQPAPLQLVFGGCTMVSWGYHKVKPGLDHTCFGSLTGERV
jgi:hypothetical protein